MKLVENSREIRLCSRGSPGEDLPLLFKGLHKARLCLSPDCVQFKQLFRVDICFFLSLILPVFFSC